MIVADLGLMVQLLLPGDRTADAEMVFRRDPEWAAPLGWRDRLADLLAGYRDEGSLTATEAAAIMTDGERLLAGREYLVPPEALIRAAWESGLAPSVCAFPLLAHDLGVPLVTMDGATLWTFPDVAVSPLQLA